MSTLESAAELIRLERGKLSDLLELTRQEHREHLQRLREVERAIQDVNQRIEQARRGIPGVDGRSAETTLEIAALHEQHQQLRHQQATLAEKLVSIAVAARKLQAVIRQSQISTEYLLGGVDDFDQNDQPSNLGQLRALEAQEEERQRMAREIHDGPAQILANGIFQLEFCQRLLEKDPDRLSSELNRLKSDLRDGLAEVRYFIFDLRLGPLAELGLAATLRRYVETFQSRFGIEIALDVDDDVQRLTIAKEMTIFRVVQEALQNARKHSGATRVSVSLKSDGELLVAKVTDDGCGFDAAVVTSSTGGSGETRHFGLVSMRERAQLIRGELLIDSQNKNGTSVTLRVPLDRGVEL